MNELFFFFFCWQNVRDDKNSQLFWCWRNSLQRTVFICWKLTKMCLYSWAIFRILHPNLNPGHVTVFVQVQLSVRIWKITSFLTQVFCLCLPFHIYWHSTGSDLFYEEIWRSHSADEVSSLRGYDIVYLHQSTQRHTREDWNLQIYFVTMNSEVVLKILGVQ